MLKTTLAVLALSIPLASALPAAAGFGLAGAPSIWLDNGGMLPDLAKHGADDPKPHKKGCDSPSDLLKPRCQV